MKNIVLAVPKSASSSLAKAVSETTGMEMIQQTSLFDLPVGNAYSTAISRRIAESIRAGFPRMKVPTKLRDRCPSHEYGCLSQYHGDICDFTIDEVDHIKAMAASRFSYKQHFPPTLRNRTLFADWRKVVLIRESAEVLEAYERRARKRTELGQKPAPWEIFLESPRFRSKLIEELNGWMDGWASEDDALIVEYADLVGNPASTLRKIVDVFECDVDIGNDYTLPKVRYSR